MIYIILYSLIISIYEINKNKFFIKSFPNLTINTKLTFFILLVIHHIISIMLLLGPLLLLSGYINSIYYIYLFLLFNIFVIIHWESNKRCILTEWKNKILQIDINEGFRNLHNIIINNYPKYIKNDDYIIEYIVWINIFLSMLILYKKQNNIS